MIHLPLKIMKNIHQSYFLRNKAIRVRYKFRKIDLDKRIGKSEQLFDQEINEEEDFEIPAFLRKQKF